MSELPIHMQYNAAHIYVGGAGCWDESGDGGEFDGHTAERLYRRYAGNVNGLVDLPEL